MPALQVRDFPENLYSDLKDYASSNHRSMAQQVIVAVEGMLYSHSHETRQVLPLNFDEEISRKARVEKRKRVFSRIDQLNKSLPADSPTSSEIVQDIRAERESRTDTTMHILSDGESQ